MALDQQSFPPAGWVTGQEAARMLSVSVDQLTSKRWRWRLTCGKNVKRPNIVRGRCNIYPIAEVEGVIAARAGHEREVAAGLQEEVPEGFVDREGARKIFGATARQWVHWITAGTVNCGVIVSSRGPGGRRTIYPVAELKKLREELYSRDTLYQYAKGNFTVPAGWSRRHEACRMFGVDRATWDGWAAGGLLPAGKRFDGGPMVFRIEDLKKVLQHVGLLAPPYPDPQRAGAYRVPLCSGITRDGREAIIDADALGLLDGAVLAWGSAHRSSEGTFVALCRPDAPYYAALRREIMNVTAADKDLQVGHVNGDPLDCRRENLLVRTIQQRTHGACKIANRKGQPCTSRFKGVFFESWTKKWRAKIEVNGRARSLGRFADEIAAAQAYDEAARRWFGKYAWLNFPDGVDAALERDAA